jgi:hypothetical protein
MESLDVLICLQALKGELDREGKLYDAHRVSEAMQLIRAQSVELRMLRGDEERRSTNRDQQPQRISEFKQKQILTLVG